jgi:hypothetical protein
VVLPAPATTLRTGPGSLTGETPFGTTHPLDAISAHLFDAPPRVTALDSRLPGALDDVIGTAMSKTPRERYASAGELATAARAAVSGFPPPRRRPGAAIPWVRIPGLPHQPTPLVEACGSWRRWAAGSRAAD